MSDIFQEVDEEVRREQLKKLWDRYNVLIVAAVFLIIAGVAGWRGYEWWQARKAAEAGAAFEAAVTLSDQGKQAEAAAAFEKVAAAGSSGYGTLARLRAAAALGESDRKAGVAAYDAIAADTSLAPPIRDLAAVRAGFLLVDSVPFDEISRRIEPLTAAGRPFRHTARELLALSAWRAQDIAATRKWAEMVVNDAETPSGTRSRVEMLLALAAAGTKS